MSIVRIQYEKLHSIIWTKFTYSKTTENNKNPESEAGSTSPTKSNQLFLVSRTTNFFSEKKKNFTKKVTENFLSNTSHR